MGDNTIGIVGAGIAGLTLGAALRQRGLPLRVFEQAPEFGQVGAGIQLAPNATRLLRRLGLGDLLDEVGVRPTAIEMRRWDDNTVLGATPLGERCEHEYSAPYLTVHRADLHCGLASLVPDVSLGMPCTRATEHTDGARLEFADGSTVDVAAVAGADGIRSAVRNAQFPDAARYSGQSIYRGVVPAERVPYLTADPKVVLWLGPGKHAVCYPIASGKLISFGATVPAQDWRFESWSEQGSVGELAAAYRGWHGDLLRLLEAADTVSRWALHDRDPVPAWSTRRITLVGDAAHPMLPFAAQGANQSIEDAVVLARCLATEPVPAALHRYAQLRQPRTAEVQLISRRNAQSLHDGSRPDPDQQRREQQWLYGYDADEV